MRRRMMGVKASRVTNYDEVILRRGRDGAIPVALSATSNACTLQGPVLPTLYRGRYVNGTMQDEHVYREIEITAKSQVRLIATEDRPLHAIADDNATELHAVTYFREHRDR